MATVQSLIAVISLRITLDDVKALKQVDEHLTDGMNTSSPWLAGSYFMSSLPSSIYDAWDSVVFSTNVLIFELLTRSQVDLCFKLRMCLPACLYLQLHRIVVINCTLSWAAGIILYFVIQVQNTVSNCLRIHLSGTLSALYSMTIAVGCFLSHIFSTYWVTHSESRGFIFQKTRIP